MKKEELAELIDSIVQYFPERMTGNEANAILAEQLADFVQPERSAFVQLFRDWISVRIPQSERKPGDGVREASMWLALEFAEKFALIELRSDIEALLRDVRAGKTYLPYFADMIENHLRGLP